jgi:hypothetical protein
VNPNDPEVAIVNSYQFEKFSLVTQPLQLSDVSPGPELNPLNENPLPHIPVALLQSALEVDEGPVPEGCATQEIFATQPARLTMLSE